VLRPIYIPLLLILLFIAGCKKDERHLAVSQIRGAAKLATTETVITKVVVGEEEKRTLFGSIKLGESSFVAYSEAIVKTGVDLTKIDPYDVKIEEKMIQVKLPAVQVLDFQYPFDKFEIDQNLTRNAVFAKIDIMDQEYFYRMAELDIRDQLEFMGIQEQTETNTRKIMESLLAGLGYNEIYITFEENGDDFIPQVQLESEETSKLRELKEKMKNRLQQDG
jgi:hypothetical protein